MCDRNNYIPAVCRGKISCVYKEASQKFTPSTLKIPTMVGQSFIAPHYIPLTAAILIDIRISKRSYKYPATVARTNSRVQIT